ncbi:transporter [Pseudaminobacter sp. 19-2017]|uniref:Transporter n=1 Tax=Pseudaminobacter soli (ex Zhang et al. 2022) TaxID=2831468 RepID=A0A942DUX7_9HYPH|nr:OmpP1/FadL family transporter [Pseudaminobacter soli]MBS3647604.1 transporter [Pseudaminobacter soli]
MKRTRFTLLASAGCVCLFSAGTALAGGLERGGYNIDLLFDPSRFAAEAGATYVMPQRDLKNVRDTDTTTGFPPVTPGFPDPLPPGARGLGGGNLNGRPTSVRDTENYWVPRIGIKAGLGDQVDCLLDYSQPWGAHTNPGLNWAGANNNIETKIDSDNYGATCSYKMDAGTGQFRVIGGVFYQKLEGFKERLAQDFSPFPVPLTGIGRLDLSADGVGWRAGVAYEIDEIAFRASLVYNSEVDLGDITGTLDLSQVNPAVGVQDVHGTASMPQSVELKVQSGIAPDWLAFGSIKWVDWSVLQTIPFCLTDVDNCTYAGRRTSLDLLYRDGWTISGGVGHKFSETLSAAASVTWDRGTSTGLGTQTDTWTFSAGASYTPNQNVELRLGGALGILTSGSSGVVTKDGINYGTDVAYDFDNDLVSALSASMKVKF